MCGIAGIYHYAHDGHVSEQVLTRMRDTMLHRGPDGASNWLSADAKVGLAHRRLSIIDLSTAATQPMCNEDGSIWITFNGEVYNHLILRKELITAGHHFRTDHSDTEVLIHGYEEWGLDGLLRRIEGDYGFVIWDGPEERMSLVRDRIGVKPLYFSLKDGRLLFGSEIKAILAHPEADSDVQPIAMYHYLSFMTTPAPLTMFKGIYKLPAGFCMQVDRNGIKASRYWDAMPGQAIETAQLSGVSMAAREQFYIDGIQSRLRDAVEKRMMADVPVGVFLSGGVDSSTNVALMSEFTSRPLETFTVGFKDFQHLNELEHADAIASRFKTNHHEVLVDESDMRGYLDQLIHHQDEPIADWVCIPLYFVSKLAKENGVKVVQVGEGSDEQFAGYAKYMEYLRLHRDYWHPFRTYFPAFAQKGIAAAAAAAGRLRPGLEVHADIVERAAAGRELFWSGAMAYWDTLKRRLVVPGSVTADDIPQELIDSGMLPREYLYPDSFNVVNDFMGRIDREHPDQDVLARMTYSEFKIRLPELLLMRVDKIAMSVSLEARVPFLDHKLVEWSLDIPMVAKIPNLEPKRLLKKAVEGLIPHDIIYRKKMGFGAPMSQWLRGEFGREVESQLLASKLLERGFFDQAYIKSLFAQHFSGRRDNGLYIWVLYNLTRWFDYWVDGGHERQG